MQQIMEYCNSLQEKIVQNRKKSKGKKTVVSGVEKLIYSTDKLLHLITKRILIKREIEELSKIFYSSELSQNKTHKKNFETQINKLIKKKKDLFNINKLRRTVIYGIPCDFVQFDEMNKDITEKLLKENKPSDELQANNSLSANSDKQPQNESS